MAKSPGPYQHFASARLRAVEEGLPLVRVANTGISAIIDAHGRVIDQLPLGAQGLIDGPLPMALASATLYGRFGNAVVFALIAVVAAAGLALGRRGSAANSSAATAALENNHARRKCVEPLAICILWRTIARGIGFRYD